MPRPFAADSGGGDSNSICSTKAHSTAKTENQEPQEFKCQKSAGLRNDRLREESLCLGCVGEQHIATQRNGVVTIPLGKRLLSRPLVCFWRELRRESRGYLCSEDCPIPLPRLPLPKAWGEKFKVARYVACLVRPQQVAICVDGHGNHVRVEVIPGLSIRPGALGVPSNDDGGAIEVCRNGDSFVVEPCPALLEG